MFVVPGVSVSHGAVGEERFQSGPRKNLSFDVNLYKEVDKLACVDFGQFSPLFISYNFLGQVNTLLMILFLVFLFHSGYISASILCVSYCDFWNTSLIWEYYQAEHNNILISLKILHPHWHVPNRKFLQITVYLFNFQNSKLLSFF